MRLLPVLTAIAVTFALYFVIFQRDALFPPSETAEEIVEESTTTTSDLLAVVAMKSNAKPIDSAVLLRGQTEADRQVDVRSEIQGLIVSQPLRKGSRVAEGQLLCEIDPGTREIGLADAVARLAEAEARLPEARAGIPAAEARVAEAQARLIEAQARVQEAEINQNAALRLKEDGFASETRVLSAEAALQSALAGVSAADSGVKSATSGIAGSQSAVQSVQALIQSARAGVAGAEKEIERLKILAPFSGLLESDTAELGSLLQPGALCATIIRLDPIKLVGFAPETEVDQIVVGSRAGARLASGKEVVGLVTFLSRSADPQTRTFRTEITVANTDQSIRDGQTAEIMIQGAGSMGHLLPQSALTLNNDGAVGIRIVDDAGIASFETVNILRDTVQGVWVDGLPDAVNVIVVGQEFVAEGAELDVTYREVSK